MNRFRKVLAGGALALTFGSDGISVSASAIDNAHGNATEAKASEFRLVRKSSFLLFALVLVFVFSSCSKEKQESAPYSGQTESPSASSTTSENKPQENDAWVEYFDKYLDSKKGLEVKDKAEDLLTTKCMKDKGFIYKKPLSVDMSKGVAMSDTRFPYASKNVFDQTWGILDKEYAKIYGYTSLMYAYTYFEGDQMHDNIYFLQGDNKDSYNPLKVDHPKWLKAPANSSPSIPATDTSPDESKPEYQAALNSDSGCENTAISNFTDGLDLNVSRIGQIGQIRLKVKESVLNEDKVTAKLKEWSECMNTKNFSIEFPPLSEKSLNLPPANPAYGEDNTLLAVADVECKQQTGFIDAWHKVLDEVEEREVKNNLPIFEAEKAYTDSMINRTNEIIEKYSSEFK
ncbi:MAG: hypothetical protein LBI63_00015 [Candidatus Ancillula sp.]|jgi:hypothetical protein|nr:hypothetical protein [Candidatus Ancillula sp.]